MRSRLQEAFWALLAERDLHAITVGDLVKRAKCNRGSFYYYYDSKEQFVESVVRDDFLGGCGLQDFVLELAAGGEVQVPYADNGEKSRRLLLLIRHGGLEIIASEVRRCSFDMWAAVLRPDGGALHIESSQIIEFFVGGVVSVLAHLEAVPERGSLSVLREYLGAVVKAALERVARIEGMPQPEILSRLRTISAYRKMSRADRVGRAPLSPAAA